MKQETIANADAAVLIRDSLARGQDVILRVQGTSMLPFFRHQKTLVTIAPASTYTVGDIVLAQTAHHPLLLHRLVQMKGDQLILKGDALRQKELITPSDVIGKVIRYETNNRVTEVNSSRYRRHVRLWTVLSPIHFLILPLLRRIVR